MDIQSLSAEDLSEVSRGLNRTLDTMIGDLLATIGRRSVKRDEMIEVLLDADYLEAYGRGADREKWKGLMSRFRALPYAEQVAFAKTVFKYKTYGC